MIRWDTFPSLVQAWGCGKASLHHHRSLTRGLLSPYTALSSPGPTRHWGSGLKGRKFSPHPVHWEKTALVTAENSQRARVTALESVRHAKEAHCRSQVVGSLPKATPGVVRQPEMGPHPSVRLSLCLEAADPDVPAIWPQRCTPLCTSFSRAPQSQVQTRRQNGARKGREPDL